MLVREIPPEHRACLAKMYRRMASRVVWTGSDPRADWIEKARKLEHGEINFFHEIWRA